MLKCDLSGPALLFASRRAIAHPNMTSTGPEVSGKPCTICASVKRKILSSGRLQFSIATIGISGA
ncbi:MAG: hypothetical protein HYZ45_11370 [Burkholderiales bacterium]|nr:hypothetical protein [Burkholderiales bacterium]